VLLKASEFEKIFDGKVASCAYWIEFTRSNYNDDLTYSRECIDYGLGLVNKALSETKDLKFKPTYWQYVIQMAETLATDHARVEILNYLPKQMQPHHHRILAEKELTPKEIELVKLEEKNDKGFIVKISDVHT